MHRGADPDAGPDSVAAVSVVLAAIESIKTGQAVDLTAAPWAAAVKC